MTERKFRVERKVKDSGSREHALRCHAPLGEVEGGTRGLALTRPALSAGEHGGWGGVGVETAWDSHASSLQNGLSTTWHQMLSVSMNVDVTVFENFLDALQMHSGS